jgi:hypothetical protein
MKIFGLRRLHNMDSGENFRAVVASDEKLKARWEAVSDKVMTDAAKLLGVTLTCDDVVALPSARLAVLTDDALSADYLNEVRNLGVVQKQLHQHELREALERGEETAHAELSRLPRHQRMSRARELGMTGVNRSPDPSSVADEATLLRRLLSLPRAERIAKARAWGLGGLS